MPGSSSTRPDSIDADSLIRTLLETSREVIVGVRADSTIFLWNREAEALTGVPRERAVGLRYLDHFCSEDFRPEAAAYLAGVAAGHPIRDVVAEIQLPDGSARTLRWNASPSPGVDGEASGIIAIGEDITERREAEERFRVLFEHAYDGLLLSDDSGVIDCNPAALAILGIQKSELIGRWPSEFSPLFQPDGSRSDAKSKALGRETLARGHHTFEWQHRRPDGSNVTVEVAVRHVTYEGKRVSVTAWRDLTPRKAMEREQQVMQQKLVQAQKLEAVGRLAGGVAHDFNNLLTAIRNGIELAIADLDPGLPSRHDLSVSLEAADRAAGLTRQLLSYSRQDSQRLERVNLATLACDTLRLMRSSIPTGITVESRCAERAMVLGDRSELEQVVMNLVLNARDAISGEGSIDVGVHTDEGSGLVHLTVRDTGIGMDEETRAKIFEPFFSTKRHRGGSGLGLAVVYGVVTQSGGDVHVASEPGAGSSFEVTLPLADPSTDAPSAPIPTHHGNARTVLLVEDDAVVRQSTARLLSRLGWRVLIAEDGESGWELFQRHVHELSLVVTDVRMPRVDGLELARRIRKAEPALPLLIVSGYDRIEGSSASTVEGARFLPKPFTLRALTTALEETVAPG